jgi:hypothetical protein
MVTQISYDIENEKDAAEQNQRPLHGRCRTTANQPAHRRLPQ